MNEPICSHCKLNRGDHERSITLFDGVPDHLFDPLPAHDCEDPRGRCNPEKNLHPIYEGVGGCDCGYWIEDVIPESDALMPPADGVPPAPEGES